MSILLLENASSILLESGSNLLEEDGGAAVIGDGIRIAEVTFNNDQRVSFLIDQRSTFRGM